MLFDCPVSLDFDFEPEYGKEVTDMLHLCSDIVNMISLFLLHLIRQLELQRRCSFS
jgi:hypothetical protein